MGSNGHKPIDRAGFLSLKPVFRVKDLDVPEIGTIRIREMSQAQRSEYRADVIALGDAPPGSTEQDTWALKVLARHIVDGDGNPVFTLDPADLNVLAAWPDRIVEGLVDEALTISGLKVAPADKAGDDSGNSVPSVDSTTS